MAYYDKLIAEWPLLTPGTTAQKLAQLNALMVAVPQPALLSPNAVFNSIVLADFLALTQLQQAQLKSLLAVSNGGMIDGSAGTLVRAWFTSVFAGKQSLTNLSALVAPYDSGTNNMQPWPVANGYTQTIGPADLVNAGNLT